MKTNKYDGQIFGTRKIIKSFCTDEDFKNAGVKIPSERSKWVLGMCMCCGSVKPVHIGTLRRNLPKRCSICSNISNKSGIESITNHFIQYEEYSVINILYHGKIVTAYIDNEDFDRCKEKSWRISKKRNKLYVVSGSKSKGTMIYLHQFIIGKAPNGYACDHIDGNSLNNRRNNLRFLTISENAKRVSARIDSEIGIRGITYSKKEKRYIVDFVYDKHRFYSKHWKTIEEAVWCRFCYEKYFGLDTIIRNPLFNEYNTLNGDERTEIEAYVVHIIETNIGKPTV